MQQVQLAELLLNGKKEESQDAIYKIRKFRSDGFTYLYGMHGIWRRRNGQHGWTLDEEHSREIIKRGLELGVNFFDTAIGYQSAPVSSM